MITQEDLSIYPYDFTDFKITDSEHGFIGSVNVSGAIINFEIAGHSLTARSKVNDVLFKHTYDNPDHTASLANFMHNISGMLNGTTIL